MAELQDCNSTEESCGLPVIGAWELGEMHKRYYNEKCYYCNLVTRFFRAGVFSVLKKSDFMNSTSLSLLLKKKNFSHLVLQRTENSLKQRTKGNGPIFWGYRVTIITLYGVKCTILGHFEHNFAQICSLLDPIYKKSPLLNTVP